MTAPRLVLIGPMGSGKTRLGKRVARLLGETFRDTDRMVVAQHGPIEELFERHGEARFRALEREAVAAAVELGGVVSLGGGAVLDAGTRELLDGLPVVHLSATAEAVEKRIDLRSRPLLRDGGMAAWQRIDDERRPIYLAVATHTLDTSHRSDDDLAGELAQWVLSREEGAEAAASVEAGS